MAVMHKIFKTPQDLKTEKDLMNGLKKAIKTLKSKGDSTRFILKGESFEFDNDILAPMLFLGTFKGDWKKYIKEQKTSADFASGFTKVGEQDGRLVLMLHATSGKGRKEKFLKSLNKGILKKLKLQAIFVDTLEEEAQVEELDTSEEIQEDKGEKEMLFKADYQQIMKHFKQFKALLKTEEADGAKQEVDLLMDLIEEWEDLSKELNIESNSKEAKNIESIKTLIADNESQILIKESKAKVKQLNKLIKEFEMISEEEEDKILEIQEQIEDLMQDIEDIGLVQ